MAEMRVGLARVVEEVENGVGEEVGVVATREQVVVPIVPSAATEQEEGAIEPLAKLGGKELEIGNKE